MNGFAYERRKKREIRVGGLVIGGGRPVVIQSMTTTKTKNKKETLRQIERLAAAGCELVRLAIADEDDARALAGICRDSPLPVVADIHFDYRLALLSSENGVAKLRINPGNIGGADRVRLVAEACRARGIPIRIGVNGGSLEKDLLASCEGSLPRAMVSSALRHMDMLSECGFDDVCVSLKSSRVLDTIEANRLFDSVSSAPLHLGVTEAGLPEQGKVTSAVGIGAMLALGIGDTIRVSLTGEPEEEIKTAKQILKALGQHESGVTIVSCPTCGRTKIPLARLAREVEERLLDCPLRITVAVMGCAVNGPGEAREADFGIAGGGREGLIFRRGRVVAKVEQDRLVDELVACIDRYGAVDEGDKQTT